MGAAILLVDDDQGIRQLLQRWLSGLDYQIVEAASGEQAFDVLTQNPLVRVAVVDLDMPGRGGAWLIDQIRQRFPAIAVVLATANDSVPGTQSLRAGVIGYVVKPLDRNLVVSLVGEGVRWSESQAAGTPRDDAGSVDTFLDRKLTGGSDDGR